ncbi:MAG: hypothetical protein JWP27_1144 [Flaviaesturariibacter sp.]|nr:hypothetical protein [Flaviaesturariibacter sp.]
MIRKYTVLALLLATFSFMASGQDADSTVRRGFRKEKLFTGGSLSLSFGNQSFLAGVNPVIGYNLTKWADAGLAINYTYSSYRDYNVNNDKLRQYIYGGGPFLRLFPVRFLFAQGQLERNMIKFKYLPPNGGETQTLTYGVTSFLAGAGYTTGRNPEGGAYGYFAVLFDLNNDARSPYRDGNNRAIPIIRAGVNIPLFGRSRN